MFHNPEPDEIAMLLRGIKTLAVVGLSPKPNRPSHQVAAAMQGFGYRIIPVRPATEEVLGETCYPSLEAIPASVSIDLVNVFRAPQYVDAIVDSCIQLKLPALWLQDGVIHHQAATRARQHGIQVVMDRCIYRDYLQYIKS